MGWILQKIETGSVIGRCLGSVIIGDWLHYELVEWSCCMWELGSVNTCGSCVLSQRWLQLLSGVLALF